MAQEEASFDLGTFQVQVRYVGDRGGPAYATKIIIPGLDPVESGVLLERLPLFSSAALAAVSQLRGLLQDGVQSFLDDYRQQTGSVSFKKMQEMRLLFLAWHDVARKITDEGLAAAEENLEAQELVESKATYGKEQEPKQEAPTADVQFDLGSIVLNVIVMGLIEGLPIWGVTAFVPGTDLYANTIIGVQSPLAIHAGQGMIENLQNVLTLGIDRYLSEVPQAKRAPVTPEKRHGTEMLYAVASTVGAQGLAIADQKLKDMLEETAENLESMESQAISDMEQKIAEYRKRKPKA